jgi:hypothetical protein
MKYYILLVTYILISVPAYAGPHVFFYKIAPGQVWQATAGSQSESQFMGQKNVTRTKNVIEYQVLKGPKSGWVTLTARIVSSSQGAAGPTDPSLMRFKADMHKSGEIRNISTSGADQMSAQIDGQGIPSEMAAMYKQSFQFMMDAWKASVFWFPEFPEDGMEPGDEFDMIQKSSMGGSGVGMEMKAVSKQVFTLEDVSEGLAYFSVKERSLTKSSGPGGGKTDTKTAGKGEAVFDLREGMWVEMTTKSRIKVKLGNIPGMGSGDSETLNIHKITMDKK